MEPSKSLGEMEMVRHDTEITFENSAPFSLEPCLGSSAKKLRFLENCRGIFLTERNHICCSNMAPSTKTNIPGKHGKVTCLRQLWLVLGVRLMEINRNSFSRSLTSLNHQECHQNSAAQSSEFIRWKVEVLQDRPCPKNSK